MGVSITVCTVDWLSFFVGSVCKVELEIQEIFGVSDQHSGGNFG